MIQSSSILKAKILQMVSNSSGLVGWWFFHEGTGSTLHDLSNNGNNGTIIGASWGSIGAKHYLIFDGTDDYVDCGNNESLHISDAITVTAWVYINTFDSYAGIVDRRVSTYEWELRINPATEKIEWRLNTSETPSTALAPVVTGQWVHIAGTYDKNLPTGSTKLFMNGILIHTVNAQGTLGYTEPINIGRGSGSQYLNGRIAEARIYNRALTLSEIQTDYQTFKTYYGI